MSNGQRYYIHTVRDKTVQMFLNLDCYLNNSGLADPNWLKFLTKVD